MRLISDIRRIFRLANPQRIHILKALALLAFAHGLLMSVPLMLKQLVDILSANEGGAQSIGWPLAIWALLQVMHAAGQYLGQITLIELGETTQSQLRQRVLGKLLDRPVIYHYAHSVGSRISLVEYDTSNINRLFASLFPLIIRICITAFATIVFLAYVNIWILVVALVPVFPAALIAYHYYDNFRDIATKLQKTNAERYALENEVLTAIDTVKIYRLQESIAEQIKSLAETARSLSIACGKHMAQLTMAVSLATFVLIAVIGLAAYFVADGLISLGDLFATYAYLALGLAVMRNAPMIVNEWGSIATSLKRIEEFIGDTSLDNDKQSPRDNTELSNSANPQTPIGNTLKTINVSFNYPATQDTANIDLPASHIKILEHLNLTLNPGSSIVILGPSGEGKTTTSKVLAGLLSPTAGQLEYNGQPIVTREERNRYLDQIGYVDQEARIFSGTVRENILHGAKQLSLSSQELDSRFEKASRVAQVRDFVDTKTRESDPTLVGPQGIRLSGGQRKRVALARALIRNPRLLLIDQMASDLQDELNSLIFKAIQTEYKLTLVYFGHRIPPGMRIDQVYVMNKGQLTSRR